jgi:hypothetical protein
MEYQETITEVSKLGAKRMYNSWMGGANQFGYGGKDGAIDVLSIIFNIDRDKVKVDLETMMEIELNKLFRS